MQFAAGVAKDLARQLIAPEYKHMWITSIVAFVALMVGFGLGRISKK
jgi:hypothetical protein